jgi:flagellar basal-body rod protein FlgG
MAATGALAYEKRFHVISNNLANVNTVGYKKDKSYFRAFNLFESIEKEPLLLKSNRSQAPSLWLRFSSFTDFSTGELKNTKNPLDLALVGSGFFCVKTPQGIQYTRRGDFTINSEELLVTQEGWPVLGSGGEIQIKIKSPSNQVREFSVSEDGYLTVDGAQVDRLRIVDFPQRGFLEKVGHTLFRQTNPNAEERPAEDVKVSQGFLEISNVDVVRAMTEMIEVLRGYESYQKMMRAIDDMNAKVINDVGKTA